MYKESAEAVVPGNGCRQPLLRIRVSSPRKEGNIAEKTDHEMVSNTHRLLPKECLISTNVYRHVPNGMLGGVIGMSSLYSMNGSPVMKAIESLT